MVKQQKDLTKDVMHELMGGVGDVNRTHFISQDELSGAGRLFAIHQLAPGDSIGWHVHEGEQECYVLTKGTALYSDNGTEVEIGAGTVTLCPSGEGHSIKNIGDDVLEFIGLITNTVE